MAMMMFPDHKKGLSEFYRVLKPGGYAALSVTANPERSFYAPIRTAIARHILTAPRRQHIVMSSVMNNTSSQYCCWRVP
jgi:ubiquinone/menaquinone biosynthesis C-methylase UbiE